MKPTFRSGFAALLGKPNVGKSTFLNTSLQRKVAITSSKPQTTRARILGIKTTGSYQLIYVDTPGFCKPRHYLSQYLLKVAKEESQGADVVLFLIDAGSPRSPEDEEVLQYIKNSLSAKPVFLLINKMDLIAKAGLLPIMDYYRNQFDFKAIIPISALKLENIQEVEQAVSSCLPPGPLYYDANTVTEQSEDWFLQELIREQALQLTHQEIPHSILAVIEEKRPGKNPGTLFLRATLYLEKPSQKKIVIGKGGQMLKKIGTLARKEIETFLGKEVYLDLWVKIKKDWRSHKDFLKAMGYW